MNVGVACDRGHKHLILESDSMLGLSLVGKVELVILEGGSLVDIWM